MRLVAVADVGAVHEILEVRCALVGIVATSVEIVEVESKAQSLVYVHSVFCHKMILAIGAVARAVVGEVGEWRQSVGEVKFVDRCHHIVVGLGEYELSLVVAVDENTVHTWSSNISCGVVFATQSCGEDSVGIHVRHGVYHSGTLVAESAVYSPYLNAAWNLLVGAERVDIVAAGALADIAVGRHLIELVELVVV